MMLCTYVIGFVSMGENEADISSCYIYVLAHGWLYLHATDASYMYYVSTLFDLLKLYFRELVYLSFLIN